MSKATNCEENRWRIDDKSIKYVLIFLVNLVSDDKRKGADDKEGAEVENNVADGRFDGGNCSWSTTVLKSKNKNARQTTNDGVEGRRSDPLDTLHSGDSQHAWHA